MRRVNGSPLSVPDLLTPTDFEALAALLAERFGAKEGEALLETAQSVVHAIESGDFRLQATLGEKIYGNLNLPPNMRASGAYLMGEGLRLQIPSLATSHNQMLADAKKMYLTTLELSPDEPRATRGLGRVLELEGEYSQALKQYTRAKQLVSDKLSTRDWAVQEPMLLHELLRITRHRINCLTSMYNGAAGSEKNRENLRILLEETEKLHGRVLPSFHFRTKWFHIEWFMALVFIGRAWGVIGNTFRMSLCLLIALRHKEHLIESQIALTSIDYENLNWWLSAAQDCGSRLREWNINPLLDELDVGLDLHSDSQVIRIVRQVIETGLPPSHFFP